MLKGIFYIRQPEIGASPITKDAIGNEFASVRCKVQDTTFDPTNGWPDGYAAGIPPGTPVHTVKGYRPEFRLAVYEFDAWRIYEAMLNPRAQRGFDLLDIENKVRTIEVQAARTDDGTLGPIIATFDDPQEVATIVKMIGEAPINQQHRDQGKTHYLLTIYLKDGTSVTRTYYPESGEISWGIMLPQTTREILER